MKYLKKFATEADVNMSVIPNVVLVGDTGRVIYNVFNGVYIQHIDGTLYTTNEWTAGGFTNDQANGVAVGSGAAKFVIAKIGRNMAWSSDTSNAIEGVLLTTVVAEAEADTDGKDNTEKILATDTGGAVYFCANYEFPNGKMGYMPALGELKQAFQLKRDISDALALIGGDALTLVWASTQYSNDQSWLTSGATTYSATYSDKDYKFGQARPFTTL